MAILAAKGKRFKPREGSVFSRLRSNTFLLAELIVFCLVVLLVLSPASALAGAQRGIALCGEIIIPSTFPFMALASFLAASRFTERLDRRFAGAAHRLLRLPSCIFPALAVGMLSGYPVGAKFCTDLYRQGRVNKKQAESFLSLCVGAGPAFIITAVGIGVFGSYAVGLLLFFSQLLACCVTAFIGRLRRRGLPPAAVPAAAADEGEGVAACFVSSVRGACIGMLNVCAFVILFSSVVSVLSTAGILAFLSQVVSAPLSLFGVSPEVCTAFVTGLFEVTSGCALCSPEMGTAAVVVCAALIGFGGLSVHFQVISILGGTDLSVRSYLFSRVVAALLAAGIAFVLCLLFPMAIPTAALTTLPSAAAFHSAPACAALLFTSGILLLSDKRRGAVEIKGGRLQ